jgi:hypothetical protein
MGGPAALTDEAYRRRADGVKVAAAQFCNNHPAGVVDQVTRRSPLRGEPAAIDPDTKPFASTAAGALLAADASPDLRQRLSL